MSNSSVETNSYGGAVETPREIPPENMPERNTGYSMTSELKPTAILYSNYNIFSLLYQKIQLIYKFNISKCLT